ncbi:hypothetical protein D3C81_1314080 [compost metagenome]
MQRRLQQAVLVDLLSDSIRHLRNMRGISLQGPTPQRGPTHIERELVLRLQSLLQQRLGECIQRGDPRQPLVQLML